jgi:hypothetical protein
MALSQLLGGWTKWGWPRLSANVLLIAFVPTLIAAGWVGGAQPDPNWFRNHVLSWSGDGILGLVRDLAQYAAVLAFGIGLVFASFDTAGPKVARDPAEPGRACEGSGKRDDGRRGQRRQHGRARPDAGARSGATARARTAFPPGRDEAGCPPADTSGAMSAALDNRRHSRRRRGGQVRERRRCSTGSASWSETNSCALALRPRWSARRRRAPLRLTGRVIAAVRTRPGRLGAADASTMNAVAPETATATGQPDEDTEEEPPEERGDPATRGRAEVGHRF